MRLSLGLVIGALVLAGPLLHVSASSESPLHLEIVQVCLPQLPACEPPAAGCAWLAPPGGHVAIEVRATRAGRPAFAEGVRLEPFGAEALTDDEGRARLVAVRDTAGAVAARLRATEGTATPVDLTLRWGHAAVLVEHLPDRAFVDDGAELRLRLVSSADGAPIEGARAVLRTDADARVMITSMPADADGRSTVAAPYRGRPVERLAVVEVVACGLPRATDLPRDLVLNWFQDAAAANPPLVEIDARAWARAPVVPFRIVGGEPPIRLEWRTAGGSWGPAPIVLPDGEHRLEARATDAHGRTSALATAVVRIDTTAPVLDPAFPADGWGRCEGLAWTARDATSGLAPEGASLVVGGRSIHAHRDGDRYSATLPEGRWEGALHAADAAGNVAQVALSLSCDRTAPRILPAWSGDAWIRCEDAAWLARDEISGLDAGSVVVSGTRVSGVATLAAEGVRFAVSEGEGVVRFAARDRAGNADEAEALLRCDAAPPRILVDLAVPEVAGHLVAPDALDVRAVDNASGVASLRVRVDGGAWTGAADLRLDGEGTRRVEVEAVDGVGRRAVETREVLVDLLAPRVRAPERVVAGAAFAVEVEEAGSGLARLGVRAPDGATLAPLDEGGRTFAAPLDMVDGATLLVEAADGAGNVEAVRVRVDRREASDAPPAHAEPPAPPAEGAESEEVVPPAPVVFRLGAVIVTPARGLVTEPVRVSGVAEGVEGGEAVLVDANGTRHRLGPLVLDGQGGFVSAGEAPAPGEYEVRLEFTTQDGGRISHVAGTVRVAPPPPPSPPPEPIAGADVGAAGAPAPGFALVLGTVALAALALARRKR